MRVCFLTHYFPPEVGAPQTRIELLARTLAGRGVSVTVHTGFPHYPSGAIAPPYRNRPWQREDRSGVTVVRCAIYPAPNRGFGRRLVNHASFAASALATAALSGPVDVLVAETPPPFTAAAAVPYALLKHAALVLHVSDRWPESAVQLGMLRNRRAIAAATSLEQAVYRRADLILAPTEGIVAALSATPAAAARTRRVWPIVELGRFAAHDPPAPERGPGQAPGEAPALRLLYAGTIGLAQELETLVEASRLAGPQTVQTTIAGDGAAAERIAALVRARRIANVSLLGALPAAQIPGLYARADAAAVLLRDRPILAGALPTKLFEAMAAGRPLIVSARGESAQLVARAGAGLTVDPGDPAALAEAIRRLQADPALRRRLGEAGRGFAEAQIGVERGADAWHRWLSEALASRRAPNPSRSGRAPASRCPAG